MGTCDLCREGGSDREVVWPWRRRCRPWPRAAVIIAVAEVDPTGRRFGLAMAASLAGGIVYHCRGSGSNGEAVWPRGHRSQAVVFIAVAEVDPTGRRFRLAMVAESLLACGVVYHRPGGGSDREVVWPWRSRHCSWLLTAVFIAVAEVDLTGRRFGLAMAEDSLLAGAVVSHCRGGGSDGEAVWLRHHRSRAAVFITVAEVDPTGRRFGLVWPWRRSHRLRGALFITAAEVDQTGRWFGRGIIARGRWGLSLPWRWIGQGGGLAVAVLSLLACCVFFITIAELDQAGRWFSRMRFGRDPHII
ncbi:uncharacterized protein LOC133494537 [Syngnathoides biaculeatus]|uniref:uncharacterized protein LOC133494537 n=1 Tax=Syngnathoides biaculeatus TaxID=300417 RepID=UPI002ADE886B|nr:uncharacterized protein LOC133494537 [Syngnathoides biaculeatus]